jgi:phenylalanyl-tRNA synthetase beta chain
MKVSRTWLQKYFETPLPSVEVLSDALTFHSFEIEEAEGDLLDVNVLPDRAADCLSHRGIAREIGAVLDIPVSGDSLRESPSEFFATLPATSALSISVEDDSACSRYIGALARGVKITPSPAWLKDALESVGQRSINNVVDATNYVMLDIGQPLHAFDAGKLAPKSAEKEKNGEEHATYAIRVRGAYEEKITTLTGEEYSLPDGTLLITDANADAPIGIAGVKGGIAAAITNDTTDIIVESANFDGTMVRKASQRLKLWTDASQRFQNRPSPELAAYGMRDVLRLIVDIAGGEVEGVVDVYDERAQPKAAHAEGTEGASVSVSLSKINSVLGSMYQLEDVEHVFDRLDFSYSVLNDNLTVTPPFERCDLLISENLIEEVGRVIGYNAIVSEPLPALSEAPDQRRFRGIERIKDFFLERGFSEISTQTFAVEGDVILANPLDQTRPALRRSLAENMRDALTRASVVAPRLLAPHEPLKLFEIGTIFTTEGESLALVFASSSHRDAISMLEQTAQDLKKAFSVESVAMAPDLYETVLPELHLETYGEGYEPRSVLLGAYRPFSVYPFALRDVAVWTPAGTKEDEVANVILSEAGTLLARIDLFDRFEKNVDGEDRVSYAFRLVFESFDRTLSDEDLNPLVEKITSALNANSGWSVR